MTSSKPSDSTFISRAEWRFVWLVTAVVMALTTLPYVFGYLTTPPGKHFMGLMLNVPDHGQYLSWWRAFQSDFLIPNRLTPEPNQPMFFNLLWWFLAQVSRLTGLGYAGVYQILRFGAGISLMAAVYRLAAVFFVDLARRKMVFLLVAFSSGFGWLLVVIKYLFPSAGMIYPLLLYNAESNYFLSLLGYPHFALAGACMAVIFEYVYRGARSGQMRHFLIAGGWALLLGWTHAYDLLIIYGVTGIFFVARWLSQRAFPKRFFWGALAVGLMSGWAALYSFLLTTLDPLWKEVLDQFENAGVYTPLPPFLFFLFGVPLFLAVAALVVWFREKRWDDARVFLAVWFFVGFALLYIPTDFQIHMLNSWQIPVMFLAVAYLFDVLTPAFRQWTAARRMIGVEPARRLAVLLLVLVIPTNLYLLAWRFVDLSRYGYPYYLEQDYIQAFDWLRANTAPEMVVLSSLEIGQYVPGISGNSAFLAHWANTVDYFDKVQRVQGFFAANAPAAYRLETVRQFGVDYVLYGPAERLIGGYDPAGLGWLTPVFETAQVKLYRVQVERLSGATP